MKFTLLIQHFSLIPSAKTCDANLGMKTRWVNQFFFFGSDLGMTYPQQNQLFSNTDGRRDTANV